MCGCESDEKRGGSVHLRGTVLDIGAWTVRREEGEYVFVVGALG